MCEAGFQPPNLLSIIPTFVPLSHCHPPSTPSLTALYLPSSPLPVGARGGALNFEIPRTEGDSNIHGARPVCGLLGPVAGREQESERGARCE
jgi:hypothetical protein